ncbi:MAG: GGDEF domain-containing protein [Roseburia sp.]|nr:GGDEF domain-containing protein [Roseburia sp.]MCM1242404.1 GGDEF domain-containing protein [Roseburia sp.]
MQDNKRLTIGILVSGIVDDAAIELCHGAMRAAKGKDFNIVVLPGKYLDRDLSESRKVLYEYQYNTLFYYARPETVDGLIIAADFIGCMTTRDRVEKLLEEYEGIPSVLAVSKIDGYVGVTFDNPLGIEEGMDYLIEKAGNTRFGMIGASSDNSDAEERKQAFIRTLAKHGLPFREEMFVEGNLTRECQTEAARLLDDNPDIEAVICVNDATAMGLYEELKRRNIQPGRDISVLGYDDSLIAMTADPPLSSVRADMEEVGAEAFRMLFKMLNGEKVENQKLSTKFIKRNSFVQVVNDEEGNADSSKIQFEKAFDDIFCRHYKEDSQKMQRLRETFCKLFEKIADVFNKEEYRPEDRYTLQLRVDSFLDMGAVYYADVDNLLAFLEGFYRQLKRNQKQESRRFELRDFFSVFYQKLVLSMNYQLGALKEEESKSNYSMKHFIREMLQFEKGNDPSYAFLLSNLEWLDVKNAFLYTFEKPLLHLYKETFRIPEEFYLKAYLQDGQTYSVPAIEQKLSYKDIFHNRFMREEERYNLVVLPLFSSEMLYGILLCDLTEGIFVNGEFLVSQIGSAAKMIALLRTNEEIQQQLEDSLVTLHTNNIVLDSLAKSDGLTGLFNRRGFYDAAEKMIEERKAQGEAVFVVYVDMNNLKIINDRYGHEEGDFSLKLIGDILVKSVEDKGVAGRIGGDEFACVIRYQGEDENKMLQGFYQKFDRYNLQSDKEYNVTVSAGAYLLEAGDTLTLAEALTQADEKLYEVKKYRKKNVAKSKSYR